MRWIAEEEHFAFEKEHRLHHGCQPPAARPRNSQGTAARSGICLLRDIYTSLDKNYGLFPETLTNSTACRPSIRHVIGELIYRGGAFTERLYRTRLLPVSGFYVFKNKKTTIERG